MLTLTLIGLVLNMSGAIILALALWKSSEVIRSISTHAAPIGGYTDKKAVTEFERDKKIGAVGITLVIIGFGFQIAGLLLF